jgi:hypothetical protein
LTEETWLLRRASDKRERAAFLRRASELLSLDNDRRQFLSDADALEADADRIEGEGTKNPSGMRFGQSA